MYRSSLFLHLRKSDEKIKSFSLEKCIFAPHANTKSYPVSRDPKIIILTKVCMYLRCSSKHDVKTIVSDMQLHLTAVSFLLHRKGGVDQAGLRADILLRVWSV